jgi:gliding motility-associated-like protein
MNERNTRRVVFKNEFLKKTYSFYIVILFVFSAVSSSGKIVSFNDCSESNIYDIACPIVLFIEPVAPICLDSTTTSFQLTITIQGSDGSGFGVWTGTGITDAVNGIFDPNDATSIMGDNVISYTFIENGCVITETTIINLNLPPDASFSMDSPICTNDFSNITAANMIAGNYEWDFGGGMINSGNNAGPYEIWWPLAGSYSISLTITTPTGCSTTNSQTIEVKKPLDAPIVDCNLTTTEIVFNWSDVPGAIGHEVLLLDGQAGTEGSNIYSVSNLMPGGESVTIQVSAIGPLPCGNTTTVKTCYTNDCPPLTINLEAVDDICLTPGLTEFELIANLENYDAIPIWSGPGIVDSVLGIFDPNHQTVSNGSNIIMVQFAEEACEYKDSLNINVFEIPTADAGGTNEITCANSDVILTGSAIGSNLAFNWTGPGIASGFNTLTLLVEQPGFYYLTVTDTVSSCMNTDSVVVLIDQNVPLADAGVDNQITCDSSSIMLQGGGSEGPTFQYIWRGPGINTNNMYAQNPVVSISGYYVLEVLETVNDCYSPTDSVYVAENTQAPFTEITQAIDGVNCEILSDQLIGNTIPNGLYEWFDASAQLIGNSSSLSANTQGTYIYNLTDTQTGCIGSDTIVVSENIPYPSVNLLVSESLDCDTKEVFLDGSNSFYGQNIVYIWSGPSGGIVSGFDENTATTVLPGNYNLTVLDTINNCSNDATANVLEILNAPEAIIEQPEEIDCNILAIDLNGSGSSGIDSLNYQWIYNNNIIGHTPIITINNSGRYKLIVSNYGSDCSDTSSVNVIYNAPPIESVGIDISTPSCFGENDGIIVLDSVIGGTPSYKFSIDGGQNFVSYNHFYNIKQGIIDFVIKDAKACQWDTSFVVGSPTELKLDIGDDLVLQMGDTLNLIANFNIPENQIDTIIWYPSNILRCPENERCFEVFGRPLNSFYARANLIDKNGCIVQNKIKVEIDNESIAYIPNTFSPNGDTRNDRFIIYAGNSVKRIKHFSVYSRWGKTIYEGDNFLPNDPAYGWDGTLNGKPLSPDVFVYWAEIELINGENAIFKGEVTLIK